MVEEAQRFCAVHAQLTNIAARQFVRHCGDQELGALEQSYRYVQRAASAGDIAASLDAVKEFFWVLLKSRKNPFLEHLQNTLHNTFEPLLRVSLKQPGYLEAAMQELRRVLQAVQ